MKSLNNFQVFLLFFVFFSVISYNISKTFSTLQLHYFRLMHVKLLLVLLIDINYCEGVLTYGTAPAYICPKIECLI